MRSSGAVTAPVNLRRAYAWPVMQEPLEQLLAHLHDAIEASEDGADNKEEIARLAAEVERRLGDDDSEGVVDDLRDEVTQLRGVTPQPRRRHRPQPPTPSAPSGSDGLLRPRCPASASAPQAAARPRVEETDDEQAEQAEHAGHRGAVHGGRDVRGGRLGPVVVALVERRRRARSRSSSDPARAADRRPRADRRHRPWPPLRRAAPWRRRAPPLPRCEVVEVRGALVGGLERERHRRTSRSRRPLAGSSAFVSSTSVAPPSGPPRSRTASPPSPAGRRWVPPSLRPASSRAA